MKLIEDGYNPQLWIHKIQNILTKAGEHSLEQFLHCVGELGAEFGGLNYIAHEVKNGSKGKVNSNIFTILPVILQLLFE